MNDEKRKAAIRAYKERKTVAGVYAVRCSASGQVWVGQTPNLASVHNRIWFTLRQGGNTSSSLQTAWSACGGDGFVFELLEELDHEELPYVRDARLKERLAYWQLKLDASVI